MSLVASSHGSMEPGCIRAVFPGAGLIRTSSFNVARSNEITRYVKAAKLAQPWKMCSYNTSAEGRMNLSALQHRDPYITDIVDAASQVALYSFSAKTNEWVSVLACASPENCF